METVYWKLLWAKVTMTRWYTWATLNGDVLGKEPEKLAYFGPWGEPDGFAQQRGSEPNSASSATTGLRAQQRVIGRLPSWSITSFGKRHMKSLSIASSHFSNSNDGVVGIYIKSSHSIHILMTYHRNVLHEIITFRWSFPGILPLCHQRRVRMRQGRNWVWYNRWNLLEIAEYAPGRWGSRGPKTKYQTKEKEMNALSKPRIRQKKTPKLKKEEAQNKI